MSNSRPFRRRLAASKHTRTLTGYVNAHRPEASPLLRLLSAKDPASARQAAESLRETCPEEEELT